MNRRSFLISGLSFTGSTLIPRKLIAKQNIETKPTAESPVLDKVCKTLNPTLTDAALSVYGQLTESSKLIDANNLRISDTETLAYSNADALMQGYVAPITYASSLASRIPIETLIKLVSHGMSPEQISELTTIASFHGHTFIVVTLRNFIVEEGRDILLKLLEKEKKYKNDPRNIPLNVLLAELMKNKESISKNFVENMMKIKDMKTNYLESLKGTRGWVDTAIVGASFPVASSNTGMARFLGVILRHGLSGRNMITRDLKKGDDKKVVEQTIRATTNLATYPSNLAVNAFFQELLGKTNLIKKASNDLQVQSHLKDLISTLFSFGLYQTAKIRMQQQMETRIRDNKTANLGIIKGLQWYIDPKVK